MQLFGIDTKFWALKIMHRKKTNVWLEDAKKTIEKMVLEEIHLILNGTDPEDRFIRENQPNEEATEIVQDRSEFAATAAEEAAIINQQINGIK